MTLWCGGAGRCSEQQPRNIYGQMGDVQSTWRNEAWREERERRKFEVDMMKKPDGEMLWAWEEGVTKNWLKSPVKRIDWSVCNDEAFPILACGLSSFSGVHKPCLMARPDHVS